MIRNLTIRLAVFPALIAATLFLTNCASAQSFPNKGYGLPEIEHPGREFSDEFFDYDVYFAAPARKGFMMINDHGGERGPYATFDEAYDVGLQQPWIIFWVEEVDVEQVWFFWKRFDTQAEAANECNWFRNLGFASRYDRVHRFTLSLTRDK